MAIDTLEQKKRRLLDRQAEERGELATLVFLQLLGIDAFLDFFKSEGVYKTLARLLKDGKLGEAAELIVKTLEALLKPTTPAQRAAAVRIGRRVIQNAVKKVLGPLILIDIVYVAVAGGAQLSFLLKKQESELIELYEESSDEDKDAIFKANIGYVPGKTTQAVPARYPLYQLGDAWYVKMGGKWYRVKDVAKEIEPGVTDVDKDNVEAVTGEDLRQRLEDLRRFGGP